MRNPRRLLFSILSTSVAVAGCAADGSLPAEPNAAFSALPAVSCSNVSGRLIGNVFTGSSVFGDLQGFVFAYQAPIPELKGKSVHLQTFHRFVLGNGTFDTVDRGVQAPIDPPVYRLNNRYSIVGGTGAYANASGFLHVHGTLIIDFTFQDPRNGDIDVDYKGRVCT